MQGLSVFNTPSVPSIMVTNWDSVATAQSVSKAADKVVGAVKDGAKQIVDVGKNSQKVVDAVGKIKVANSVSDNQQPVSPTMQTVHTGFRSVAATTARIADSILECPAEAKVAVDRARGVHRNMAL